MKEDWMSVLPSKWAFRIKWFPDVLIKKCKAQFCVRSDLQKEGIYYFKSWSPVVQWTTGHTMMILAANIASSLTRQMSQLPCTCWACHQWAHPCRSNSWLPPWPKHGLETQKVSLQPQALSTVFLLLPQSTLETKELGLKQSSWDPCLLVGNNVIAVVYVDDILSLPWRIVRSKSSLML